ncbi:MAG: site-2 protease family protein [Acidobacteria bacterium]|nr:site-2 protease family protein [Acidobacteriota bacterium]
MRWLKNTLQRPLVVAQLFNIPIKVDATWLPMALLHTWLVAQFWFARGLGNAFPLWVYLFHGLIATALLFVSILVHELAHALVARMEGLQTYDIQLHIFGGWARLVGEPRHALSELRIAVAGPASSFLLAVIFWLCLLAVNLFAGQRDLAAWMTINTFLYLAVANLTLAIFNLLPGLPLDGGRALRAWLWHRRKDVLSATKTAKQFGVAIAYMLISYGLFLFISGAWRGTLWRDTLAAAWLLAVGVYLMNAAENDYRFRLQQQTQAPSNAPTPAEGTAGAVMRTPVVSVEPHITISEFIDRTLAQHRQTNFPVASGGRLHGILALERLRAIPKEQWERLAIRDVMSPIDETHFVTVRASLAHVAHQLEHNEFHWLAVIDAEGQLVGSVTKEDLRAAA